MILTLEESGLKVIKVIKVIKPIKAIEVIKVIKTTPIWTPTYYSAIGKIYQLMPPGG